MNVRITDYAYIFVTVGLTVYGQLILKWRIGVHGALPGGFRKAQVFGASIT